MVVRFQEKNLIKSRGKQRTDSTQVIAAIRQVNRLELVGETLRAALNEIATVSPEWLKAIISEDWYERYSWRFDNYRLPKKQNEREEMARQIGLDGYYLLQQIWGVNDEELRVHHLWSVEVLRQVWIQQYTLLNQQLVWRTPDSTGLPPNSICIESPYDIEARNSSKRGMNWTGYKVHFTETCDQKNPNLITNVETTSATTPDGEVTSTVHQKLADKNLLPDEHFVDAAYVDAYQLVESHQDYQVSLIGPVAVDTSWQAKSQTSFDISTFIIDWEQQIVQCPQGHLSRLWRNSHDTNGNPLIEVVFDRHTCGACNVRHNCTSSSSAPRKLKLRPQAEYEALAARRREQLSTEFKQTYACRAGIEGTISQAVRRFDLRRTRYWGLAKTHLHNVATACAINLSRFFASSNHIAKAQTRLSALAALRFQLA
jgi:transposase